MMKPAKPPDFPDILPIHNIVSPLPQFSQDPPYRRQCQSGGQQAARSCGHSAPRAPDPHPQMPGAGRCPGGLGAASSTWCGWDTCPGSSWSSGCHCGVSAMCGHSHFLQRHQEEDSERQFPASVCPLGETLRTTPGHLQPLQKFSSTKASFSGGFSGCSWHWELSTGGSRDEAAIISPTATQHTPQPPASLHPPVQENCNLGGYKRIQGENMPTPWGCTALGSPRDLLTAALTLRITLGSCISITSFPG